MDNINQLGEEMESIYSEYETNFVEDNNNASINNISNNANNLLSINNGMQNLVGIGSNILQEKSILTDQLLSMQNEDLTDQLRNLNNIDSNIENKNRFIDQVNNNIDIQNTNINVLIISLIFSIVVLSILGMYGYGMLGKGNFYYILISIGMVYILYILYAYDIFYIKTALTKLFTNNFEKRLGDSVKSWSQNIESALQQDLYGNEQDWINNNCNCPSNNTLSESEENISSELINDQTNYQFEETSGYFIYDGSTPQQLISPTPTSPPLNENINWVDYSQNSSKNYYNYNATSKDPIDLLKKALNNSNSLIPNGPTFNVNSRTGGKAITYSANF